MSYVFKRALFSVSITVFYALIALLLLLIYPLISHSTLNVLVIKS